MIGEALRITEDERKIIKANILEAIVFQPVNVIRYVTHQPNNNNNNNNNTSLSRSDGWL
jgi:hypothetical protein